MSNESINVQVSNEQIVKALQDVYAQQNAEQVANTARFKAGLAAAEVMISELRAQKDELAEDNRRLSMTTAEQIEEIDRLHKLLADQTPPGMKED